MQCQVSARCLNAGPAFRLSGYGAARGYGASVVGICRGKLKPYDDAEDQPKGFQLPEESYRLTPLSELEDRCRRLQEHMQRKGTDGVLMLQKADLFYFSGSIQQALLYIPAEGEPVLMVRKDYERAEKESLLPNIAPFSRLQEIADILRQFGIQQPATLGMELDVLPAGQYFSFSRIFEKSSIVDISSSIRLVRSVKSGYEIDLIRRAAAFSDEMASLVPFILKEGMPEVELAGLIEAEARKRGHQGIVKMRLWGGELFYGHVMAGASAAVPSYLSSPTGGMGLSPAVAQGPSLRPIKRHEPVLVDMVFALDGYLSDHTRIFSIGGLPEDLTAAHNAMLEIQEAVKEAARPGKASGELYELGLAMAEERGLSDYFMGAGEKRIKFVGHGIGLELDEFPFLAKGQSLPLEEGMIVALEPKVIFPGRGVVGIENTHVVSPNGLRQLSGCRQDIVDV